MGRPKKKVQENKGADEKKSAPKFDRHNIKDLSQAKELASKYVPTEESDRYEKINTSDGEKMVDKFDVMYVTKDGNVFTKQNEGSAFYHARKQRLGEPFKVKFE